MRFAGAAVDLIQSGKLTTYGADTHLLRGRPVTQAALSREFLSVPDDKLWIERQFQHARELLAKAQNDEHLSASIRRQLVEGGTTGSNAALIDALLHAAQLPVPFFGDAAPGIGFAR